MFWLADVVFIFFRAFVLKLNMIDRSFTCAEVTGWQMHGFCFWHC